ncbi:MAG: hypothetical protein KDI37_04835 [Xanthomonadales bacterium]|nr:hypothetical protein [Xanthomonadales bacterium]MCB1641037.1 hypothetical protein [Xanthomonadales bacterium]
MKSARLIAWLVVGPLLIVGLSWWLTDRIVDGASDRASSAPDAADMSADAEVEAAAARMSAIADRISEREPLVRHCVRQAMRGLSLEANNLVPMLVMFKGRGCGENCDAEAIAQQLVNDYRLEGLQVLLVRTSVSDIQPPSPAGVPTISVAGCAPLIRDLGDDYVLRWPDGRFDSTGHRFESAVRRPPPEDPNKPPPPPEFNPEAVVRQGLNLDPS